MDSRPIGVFDSGMGGMSLWREIRASLPEESIVYLGDGKNCPYGDKTPEEVVALSFKAVEELLSRDCKMIVVACNTATSTAIAKLRAAYPDTPFVGMEPAIKPACQQTKSGVVGVLATKRSLESDLFAATQERYAAGIEVVTAVGKGFVEIVESGLESSPQAYEVVKQVVDALAAKGVDKIVLGCTHYPFLIEQIVAAIGGREIDVIDPSPAIVKRIKQLLEQYSLAAPRGVTPQDDFMSFAGVEYCKGLINKVK